MNRPKILLLDGESRDALVLVHVLTQDGYDVLRTSDLSRIEDVFRECQPSAVIADAYPGSDDGLAVCRELRRISHCPILALSNASDEKMIVDALDAGADDYIVKPFGIREILARLRAALRRDRTRMGETLALEVGDFRIDGCSVELRGCPVKLTPKEFDLLTYMAQRPGRVLSYKTLAQAVWRGEVSNDPAPLRVLVGSLRKKIESDPRTPSHLITHPRVGYAFRPTGPSRPAASPHTGAA